MDLVDVVQEVAALHQEDVVNVGAGGRLMQGQAAEAYITGEVFVQHPSSCKILNVVFLLLCYLDLSNKASSSRTSPRRPP